MTTTEISNTNITLQVNRDDISVCTNSKTLIYRVWLPLSLVHDETLMSRLHSNPSYITVFIKESQTSINIGRIQEVGIMHIDGKLLLAIFASDLLIQNN